MQGSAPLLHPSPEWQPTKETVEQTLISDHQHRDHALWYYVMNTSVKKKEKRIVQMTMAKPAHEMTGA